MGIQCQNVYKTYASSQGRISVLEGMNLRVEDQQFVSLVGPSGCGKTTLLKLLAGLIEPSGGRILFDTMRRNGNLANAMVFQEHGVFPWLTVLQNVAFGLEMQGVARREREEHALQFLGQVGLTEFAQNYPHQLSAGMRQRVAIARAFVTNTDVLLMDEPFSALDAQTKLVLQEELLRIWQEHKKTVVYVTHDIEEAIVLSDRVLVMKGRPSHIVRDMLIPLARPRRVRDRDRGDITNLKWQIWDLIEVEVRQSMEQFQA